MNIKLNDKYRITSDTHNYILQEGKYPDPHHKMTKNTHEIRWNDVGYYGNINHLIESLLEREIKESDAYNWSDVIKKLEETKVSITEKLSEVS